MSAAESESLSGTGKEAGVCVCVPGLLAGGEGATTLNSHDATVPSLGGLLHRALYLHEFFWPPYMEATVTIPVLQPRKPRFHQEPWQGTEPGLHPRSAWLEAYDISSPHHGHRMNNL